MPVTILCRVACEDNLVRFHIDTTGVRMIIVESMVEGEVAYGPWDQGDISSDIHLCFGMNNKLRLQVLHSDETTDVTFVRADRIDLYVDYDPNMDSCVMTNDGNGAGAMISYN